MSERTPCVERPDWHIVAAGQLPGVWQGSLGFHATVTQPIYTAGRIGSEAAAAGAQVSANRSEVERTKLDVKMNVAEVYVAVLRGKRVAEVARSKVNSLKAHARDVDNRFQVDKASRNEVLAVQVASRMPTAGAWAENTLEMMKAAYNRALGRDLMAAVEIVDLQDDGDPGAVDELVRTAWRCRPEISELSARPTALPRAGSAESSKSSPQVSFQGGYVYQGDNYIQPNGIAVAAVTAEWNLFDSGRACHQATALSQRGKPAQDAPGRGIDDRLGNPPAVVGVSNGQATDCLRPSGDRSGRRKPPRRS